MSWGHSMLRQKKDNLTYRRLSTFLHVVRHSSVSKCRTRRGFAGVEVHQVFRSFYSHVVVSTLLDGALLPGRARRQSLLVSPLLDEVKGSLPAPVRALTPPVARLLLANCTPLRTQLCSPLSPASCRGNRSYLTHATGRQPLIHHQPPTPFHS